MRTGRRFFAATAIAIALVTFTVGAMAAETIRIGEINSYSRLPVFTQPYRNGWELAVEEINAAGGVLGKQLRGIADEFLTHANRDRPEHLEAILAPSIVPGE